MRTLLAIALLVTSAAAQFRTTELSRAIAKAEGFYAGKGTIPARCNNPGDIRPNTLLPGQVGWCSGGYAKFRNARAGFAALDHQLEKIADGSSTRYNVNMTLAQFGKTYACDTRWGKNVAKALGVTPQTQLWEVLGVPPLLTVKPSPLQLVSKKSRVTDDTEAWDLFMLYVQDSFDLRRHQDFI